MTGPDPIFLVIERHKAAAAAYDAAAHRRMDLNDLPPLTAAQRAELARLDAANNKAYAACQSAAAELIKTTPTTLAGIAALLAYVRVQIANDGVFMPHRLGPDMAWVDTVFETIETAVTALASETGGQR